MADEIMRSDGETFGKVVEKPMYECQPSIQDCLDAGIKRKYYSTPRDGTLVSYDGMAIVKGWLCVGHGTRGNAYSGTDGCITYNRIEEVRKFAKESNPKHF